MEIRTPGDHREEEFKSLKVQGYRRLRAVDIRLRPLTVLIGANGAGKSSLLEVFALLASSARGRLAEFMQESGGIVSVATSGTKEGISIEVERGVEAGAPLRYKLQLQPQGPGYAVSDESLSQQQRPNKDQPFFHIQSKAGDVRYIEKEGARFLRPNWEHDPRETALSQVPKLYRAPEALRQALASCQAYSPIDVGGQSPVRLPQTMQPATLPGSKGETLTSCLFNWREADSDRYGVLTDTLRAGFPSFEELKFPIAAAGRLQLTWKDRDFSSPFDVSQLSEGTVRFLWLAALLLSEDLPAITLLDEPELSLHPELLSLLANLLRDAASRTNLLVATHSDRLIRFLSPMEVLVCDSLPDGGASFTWGDDLNLEKWLQDYSLDELWSMNVLAGRAQP